MPWVDSRQSILIPALVKARLDGALRRLRETAELCKMEPWWARVDGPTYGEWVSRMLDMLEGRRRRKRRYRANRMLAQLDWRPTLADDTPA